MDTFMLYFILSVPWVLLLNIFYNLYKEYKKIGSRLLNFGNAGIYAFLLFSILFFPPALSHTFYTISLFFVIAQVVGILILSFVGTRQSSQLR